MKVKELIKELKLEDPEREVVLQRDMEGNGYSPLQECWRGAYVSEQREAFLEKLTEENEKAGYTEDDVSENGAKALFLVPRD